MKDITQLERVQRTATKYIVQDRNQDYKSRLIALQLLLLMYWFELLNIMFLVKCIKQPDESFNLSRSQLPTPAVAPAAINCNSDSIELLIIGISIMTISIAFCAFELPSSYRPRTINRFHQNYGLQASLDSLHHSFQC